MGLQYSAGQAILVQIWADLFKIHYQPYSKSIVP
jgi:hypothetical protein